MQMDAGTPESFDSIMNQFPALFSGFVASYRSWSNAVRQQALADAYIPIVRGFLLPGCAYYVFVTWGHWKDESGTYLAILGGLSALTAIAYYVMRQYFLTGEHVKLRTIELSGLATNLLMYINVVVYMTIHFEESKLIYFVLMAVVFSTSGVTLRVTLFSIILSIGTLYWFVSTQASEAAFAQFVFIGVATSFASFGMAALLRKAILRQIEARLLADELAAKALTLANTDMLTGIPSRRAILDTLNDLVARKSPFWFGIVDLDGFKAINDVYGHLIGDALLQEVVNRMREHSIACSFTLGRLGGDEFAIIVPGSPGEKEIEGISNMLLKSLAQPFEISLLRLTIGASAGFAHFPTMGHSSGQLYERADFALYKAKACLRGHTVIFNSSEDREMKDNIALERAMREADLQTELSLVYQPQYSPGRDRITGFEALARWHSPVLGHVPPDKFIRVAERSGLMQSVTRIMFAKALDMLAKLPADISLAFNLSALDIADRSFSLYLLDRIMESGIAPSRIEFEITETAVMADFEVAHAILETFSNAGCGIALDDFGSGYSSFEYIDRLPLDKLKVDKSFVRKVVHNATSREIVAGVIALCKRLDLVSVLEGVETEEEMRILAPYEPDLIQGYLFGKPMQEAQALAAVCGERYRQAV